MPITRLARLTTDELTLCGNGLCVDELELAASALERWTVREPLLLSHAQLALNISSESDSDGEKIRYVPFWEVDEKN